MAQGAGPVGDDHHDTGLIRAGVNLGRFGDADKPGVIAALVLDGGFQPLKGVLLRAQPGGDGRNVLPVGLGDHLGRYGGVFADGNFYVLQGPQKVGALVDGLLVGVDFPDILQLHAGLDQQIVAHLQAGAADDEEIMLQHQVVDFVHRPGGAVFDGKHAELAHTGFHRLEHMLKALEEHDIRQLEQPLAGQLGERALHALAGYAGALGEQLRGLFQHGLNLLVGAGAAGGLGVLIGPAHRQDGLVHRLGVFRKRFSGLLRHPAQQFPLTGGVLDRELVGLLIRADGFGQLHPAAEQVYKLLVDLVDFFPHLF